MHNELSGIKQYIINMNNNDKTVAVAVFDEHHNCLYTNCFFNQVFQYSESEICKLHELDLIAFDSRDLVKEKLNSDQNEHYEALLIKKDRDTFWGSINTFKFTQHSNSFIITTYKDIDAEKHSREKLITLSEEFEAIFDNSQIGIALISGDRIIQRINNKVAEIFNYPDSSSLIGKSIQILHQNEESFTKFETYYKAALLQRKSVKLEHQLVDSNGKLIWISLSGNIIDKNDPPSMDKGVVWMFENIDNRKKTEDKLLSQARTDELTGIGNRRFFTERSNVQLEIHTRYNRPFSFLMLDIDHFKKINDTYGHNIGDKTLQHFVNICKKQIRHTDIFARLGGEEFGVLLLESDIDIALGVAEKIRSKVEELTPDPDHKIPAVTVSIGVATLEKDFSLKSIMKRADNALYAAKQNGRNQIQHILLKKRPKT